MGNITLDASHPLKSYPAYEKVRNKITGIYNDQDIGNAIRSPLLNTIEGVRELTMGYLIELARGVLQIHQGHFLAFERDDLKCLNLFFVYTIGTKNHESIPIHLNWINAHVVKLEEIKPNSLELLYSKYYQATILSIESMYKDTSVQTYLSLVGELLDFNHDKTFFVLANIARKLSELSEQDYLIAFELIKCKFENLSNATKFDKLNYSTCLYLASMCLQDDQEQAQIHLLQSIELLSQLDNLVDVENNHDDIYFKIKCKCYLINSSITLKDFDETLRYILQLYFYLDTFELENVQDERVLHILGDAYYKIYLLLNFNCPFTLSNDFKYNSFIVAQHYFNHGNSLEKLTKLNIWDSEYLDDIFEAIELGDDIEQRFKKERLTKDFDCFCGFINNMIKTSWKYFQSTKDSYMKVMVLNQLTMTFRDSGFVTILTPKFSEDKTFKYSLMTLQHFKELIHFNHNEITQENLAEFAIRLYNFFHLHSYRFFQLKDRLPYRNVVCLFSLFAEDMLLLKQHDLCENYINQLIKVFNLEDPQCEFLQSRLMSVKALNFYFQENYLLALEILAQFNDFLKQSLSFDCHSLYNYIQYQCYIKLNDLDGCIEFLDQQFDKLDQITSTYNDEPRLHVAAHMQNRELVYLLVQAHLRRHLVDSQNNLGAKPIEKHFDIYRATYRITQLYTVLFAHSNDQLLDAIIDRDVCDTDLKYAIVLGEYQLNRLDEMFTLPRQSFYTVNFGRSQTRDLILLNLKQLYNKNNQQDKSKAMLNQVNKMKFECPKPAQMIMVDDDDKVNKLCIIMNSINADTSLLQEKYAQTHFVIDLNRFDLVQLKRIVQKKGCMVKCDELLIIILCLSNNDGNVVLFNNDNYHGRYQLLNSDKLIVNYFNNINFNGFHNVPKYFQFHQFELSACKEASSTFDDEIKRFYNQILKGEFETFEQQIDKIIWKDKSDKQQSNDLGANLKLSNIHLNTLYYDKIEFKNQLAINFPVEHPNIREKSQLFGWLKPINHLDAFFNYYDVTNKYHESRKLCVIISSSDVFNGIFSRQSKKRSGDFCDTTKMALKFTQLEYTVELKLDLMADELKAYIDDLSNNSLYASFNSIMVIIQSHGNNNGVVYGADDVQVNINEDILYPISQSKIHHGKPKCYFINACRGDKKDFAIPVKRVNLDDFTDDFDQDDIEFYNENSIKDTMVVYSTIKEYVSYRDDLFGSLFIQSLCYALDTFTEDINIYSLLHQVNLIMCSDTPIIALQNHLGNSRQITEIALYNWKWNYHVQ